jgi:hypothetical protein
MSVRRIPFRVRLTLCFAAIIILLFGGLAFVLHARFEVGLDQGINRSLRTRAGDLATLLKGRQQLPSLPESGGAFAEVVDPSSGRVRAATPGYTRSLLSPQELRRAAVDARFIDRGETARLLAGPLTTQPPAVLVVGASLAQRNSALTTLSELLFIGGPMLLILTCVSRSPRRTTSSTASATRSTGCSAGSRTRSRVSARSSPRPGTSFGRRWRFLSSSSSSRWPRTALARSFKHA